jgi:hypothetical protein
VPGQDSEVLLEGECLVELSDDRDRFEEFIYRL